LCCYLLVLLFLLSRELVELELVLGELPVEREPLPLVALVPPLAAELLPVLPLLEPELLLPAPAVEPPVPPFIDELLLGLELPWVAAEFPDVPLFWLAAPDVEPL